LQGKEFVENYVARNKVYYAQTPQTFNYKIFCTAMKKAEEENFIGTDESMLVQRAGYNVKIVDGSSLNIKITSNEDLKLFEILTENR
jgi:2-C-methyl-D-erythritol 4-phosphate cytidylyltransferase